MKNRPFSYLRAVRWIMPLLLLSAGSGFASDSDRGQATAVLEQAVKANPNNAELWVHLGFAYRKTGSMEQSQSAFEKARSLDSRNRDALYMLGLIYEKKNMTQEAQRVWQQYIDAETDPTKRSDAQKHLNNVAR